MESCPNITLKEFLPRSAQNNAERISKAFHLQRLSRLVRLKYAVTQAQMYREQGGRKSELVGKCKEEYQEPQREFLCDQGLMRLYSANKGGASLQPKYVDRAKEKDWKTSPCSNQKLPTETVDKSEEAPLRSNESMTDVYILRWSEGLREERKKIIREIERKHRESLARGGSVKSVQGVSGDMRKDRTSSQVTTGQTKFLPDKHKIKNMAYVSPPKECVHSSCGFVKEGKKRRMDPVNMVRCGHQQNSRQSPNMSQCRLGQPSVGKASEAENHIKLYCSNEGVSLLSGKSEVMERTGTNTSNFDKIVLNVKSSKNGRPDSSYTAEIIVDDGERINIGCNDGTLWVAKANNTSLLNRTKKRIKKFAKKLIPHKQYMSS